MRGGCEGGSVERILVLDVRVERCESLQNEKIHGRALFLTEVQKFSGAIRLNQLEGFNTQKGSLVGWRPWFGSSMVTHFNQDKM